jgi:UDP-glucose 4-epimerase
MFTATPPKMRHENPWASTPLLTPPESPTLDEDLDIVRKDAPARRSAIKGGLSRPWPTHILAPMSLMETSDPSLIVVIGGLGYIGSHTSLELLKEGHSVLIVDDLSNSFAATLDLIRGLATDHFAALDSATTMPVLSFAQTDYRSEAMHDLIRSLGTRIKGVIHFAAYKSLPESLTQPLRYYQNNICGLVELLVTLQETGIKNFVFSSSATVYGGKANEGAPLKEEDLVHFTETWQDKDGKTCQRVNGARDLTSPYGRTKYFAEAILADVAHADPSMCITALRYFNPVGCHPSGLLRENPRQMPTNLFPVIASVMQGKRPILEVFGSDWATRDGTAIRDFIHVVDLAQGHVAALVAAESRGKGDAFRTYNLGTGLGMTVAEVISSFERASGLKIPVVMASRRDGDVGICIAETHKAESELGWKTKKTVDECARDTWNALNMISGTKSAAGPDVFD